VERTEPSPEEKDDPLRGFNALGFLPPIREILQYGETDASFSFEFTDGTKVEVPTSAALFSPRKLEPILAERRVFFRRRTSPAQWRLPVELIFRAAKVVRTDTILELLEDQVANYLYINAIHKVDFSSGLENQEEADNEFFAVTSGVFRDKQNRTYLQLREFQKHLTSVAKMQIKKLGQRLLEIGFARWQLTTTRARDIEAKLRKKVPRYNFFRRTETHETQEPYI
jgi:hypothetical protein